MTEETKEHWSEWFDWTELYPKIFDYTAKCPECKRVCTNYDDEV